MDRKTKIAAAGNVMPGALACLKSLGFDVSREEDSWRAESALCVFVADDPLMLLGLVKFHDMRGDDWRPSDAEVDEFLALDGGQ
ncbi:MAG TPA: hypothetical protein VGM81_15370 [Burkholderiaceae bacterium]|jgi:hypothetical protein